MDYGKKVQIHNFVMLKYRVDKTSFIKVSSVNGDWSVSYREDNIMFLVLDKAEGKEYDALYNIFTTIYGISSIIDPELTSDVFDAINRYVERRKAEAVKVSGEEDRKILEEERAGWESEEANVSSSLSN